MKARRGSSPFDRIPHPMPSSHQINPISAFACPSVRQSMLPTINDPVQIAFFIIGRKFSDARVGPLVNRGRPWSMDALTGIDYLDVFSVERFRPGNVDDRRPARILRAVPSAVKILMGFRNAVVSTLDRRLRSMAVSSIPHELRTGIPRRSIRNRFHHSEIRHGRGRMTLTWIFASLLDVQDETLNCTTDGQIQQHVGPSLFFPRKTVSPVGCPGDAQIRCPAANLTPDMRLLRFELAGRGNSYSCSVASIFVDARTQLAYTGCSRGVCQPRFPAASFSQLEQVKGRPTLIGARHFPADANSEKFL